MNIKDIAHICHEANRALCLTNNDNSQKSWEECGTDIQNSATNGVSYRLNNPNCSPEDQHISWMNFKKADGWIYGLEKDAIKKEHPCMIEYDKLPEFQKTKDHLFVAIVDSLRGFLSIV